MTGVVLDFVADGLATSSVDVSVLTPTRAESPVRAAFGDGCVSPFNSVFCTGFETHVDISADGNEFVATLLWSEPPWAEEPYHSFRVFDGDDLISARSPSGWPQAGSLGTLPDTPRWLAPADLATKHPLHEAIEWQLFDADLPVVRLRLSRGTDGVWNVEVSGDATSLVVPEPPSTVDPVALFGTTLRGVLIPYWQEPTTLRAEAFSISEAARFAP